MDNSEHPLDCICAWCEVERQNAEMRAAKEQAYARRSAATCSEVPWTPRVKKMLMLSRKVALHYRQNYVGSEHLLAGILAEKEGSAARLLERHGITMDLLVKEYGWQTQADAAEESERAEYERLRAKFDPQNAQAHPVRRECQPDTTQPL